MKTLISKSYLLPIIVLLFCITFLVTIFILMRDCYVDDSFIGFRVVENAVSGNGWVFNAGERVEAVTNIGWLLILFPFAMLIPVTILAKLLNLIFILTTVYLLLKIFNGFKYSQYAYLLLPVFLIIHFDYIFFSLGGMETAFLALQLVFIIWIGYKNRYTILIPIVSALAFLTRPETLIIFPITFFILILLDFQQWKKYFIHFLIYLSILGILEIIRYLYYGAWLPNTFLSKPGQSILHIFEKFGTHGLQLPNISTPFSEIFIVILIITGIFTIQPHFKYLKALLSGTAICAYLFALYAPTDWTLVGRYFAPYVPVLMLMVIIGGQYFYKLIKFQLSKQNQYYLKFIMLSTLLAVVMVNAFSFLGYFNRLNLESYPNFVMTSKNLVEPAKWIAENTPDNSVIASRRIGALAYYSNRYIFDYTFGLPHRDVALKIKKNKRPNDSPNSSALTEIWSQIQPDYLLEDTQKILPLLQGSSDTLWVQGEKFVIYKKFRLSTSRNWILCKKIGNL